MTYVFVALYVICAVIYTQVFKFALQTAKDHGVMTIIMQGIGALFVALFIPFFGWELPANWLPVFLLIAASIF
jgi:hypothetical protein